MATNNPVYQVLVTSGNQALLAAGSRPDALAVGQLGVFNFHTGLSIDGSVPADAKDIFLAVGIDPNGVGSLQDINTSAGQVIQVQRTRALTFKGTVGPLPKIVDIGGFTAKCEADYAIKVEFRNGQIYAENGYNQFTKTFTYHTGCCSDQCEPCGTGDCNELATGLVTNINLDPDLLVSASYFAALTVGTVNDPTTDGSAVITVGSTAYTVALLAADTAAQAATKIAAAITAQAGSPYTATAVGAVLNVYPKTSPSTTTALPIVVTSQGGTGLTITAVSTTRSNITVAGLAAFVAANPGVCVGVRLTSNPMALQKYTGSINLQYVKDRVTDIIVSSPEGFTCNGTITTIQELQQEEGSGYDIRQQEYFAGGWNGKPGPYRTSTITGTERQGITYFAVAATKYNQFVLTYDQFSVGGWLEYLNNLQTILAVPCADATTLTAIATVFDLIFTQFGGMTGDVAANGDCTNVRTGLLTPATDGIESLS